MNLLKFDDNEQGRTCKYDDSVYHFHERMKDGCHNREPKILGISLAIPLYSMRDYVYRLKEINIYTNIQKFF